MKCDYCQKYFESEHARSIHEGKFHDDSSPTYGLENYRDKNTLSQAYDRHDGNVAAVSRTLDCGYGTARKWLIEYEIGRYGDDV